MIDKTPFIQHAEADTLYVHNCFSSMFSGMLNWFHDELYPRFNYKVIATYDKAVQFFNNKKHETGEVQSPKLPAITLDPILDFSPEERVGRLLWMYKHLDAYTGSRFYNHRIQMREQGVVLTPVFTRYQGTVEVTFWFASQYELMDFRVILLQNCGGYSRWIRPKFFWTHMIIPKELYEFDGNEGYKLDWNNTDSEVLILETTNSKEYAYPFDLNSIWRLDSFSDASTKQGGDQLPEYKLIANLTWEAEIPTFIRLDNYAYDNIKVNLTVATTQTIAAQPLIRSFDMLSEMKKSEVLDKVTNRYNVFMIEGNDNTPCVKLSLDQCDAYPTFFKQWNHYSTGKLVDISTITNINDFRKDDILLMDVYQDSYLPYIRKCSGVISKQDETTSILYTKCQSLQKPLICNFSDDIYQVFVSLVGSDITMDPIGRLIYRGFKTVSVLTEDNTARYTLSENLLKILDQYESISGKLDPDDYVIKNPMANSDSLFDSDVMRAVDGVTDGTNKEFILPYIVHESMVNNVDMYVDDILVDRNDYVINTSIVTFINAPAINSVVTIKKLEKNKVSMAKNIINYMITRTDQVNFHTNGIKLQIDLSEIPEIIPSRIVCCSYSGLLEYTKDYDIDVINKKIIFEIEPMRDRIIQVFAAQI